MIGLVSDENFNLADLNSTYNYYVDTKIAWRIVHNVVAAGNTFAIRNMSTGTVTTHGALSAKARGYVSKQLAEATFQQFISTFENFFFDLLRPWLMAYPRNLIRKKVDFQHAGERHVLRIQENAGSAAGRSYGNTCILIPPPATTRHHRLFGKGTTRGWPTRTS
jgi:hypothetical protein